MDAVEEKRLKMRRKEGREGKGEEEKGCWERERVR